MRPLFLSEICRLEHRATFRQMRSLRALRRSQDVQVGEDLCFNDLTYAGDIAHLGVSAKAVQNALDSIDRFAKTVGLRMNKMREKFQKATESRTPPPTQTSLDGATLSPCYLHSVLLSTVT